MAGGTHTCETSTEKLSSVPARRACSTLIALAGAVVSNPMAKKTTCLSGFCCAKLHRIQRRIHHAHIAAAARTENRSRPEPGTRSMSP